MAQGQLTFRELCNRVLLRLGKSQSSDADFTAATSGSDTWPALVKDAVNDAQREVYKEHDWSTLYHVNTFTTSVRTYDLSVDFSDYGRAIDLVDTTNEQILTPVSHIDLDYTDPGLDDAGAPTAYAIAYPNLLFNRTPAAVAFRFRYVRRVTPLSSAADRSILPEYCDLVLVAWAYWQFGATREDFADSGRAAQEAYQQSLARAISQDRRRVDRVYRLQPLYRDDAALPGPRFPPSSYSND